jgi:hypothetical protein
MGKVKCHTPKLNKKFNPLVSVCTPTFNRRPFIPMMLECFRNQTYPKDRIEWIIVDDGTDSIQDLIEAANIPQIKYFREEKKMALGEKRNYMHSKVKGTIIVYMDDDDYYPPERVSHAVDTLMKNRQALCAGSSEIYVYFKHLQQMYQAGPYGPNHATAGTFAFRAELLKDCRYEDHAALAEEKHFLKNYTVPFVQLDPMKTILVFSHEHNTFDKRKLLENPHEQFFKPSPKTVDQFIRQNKEASIKQFFLTDIDKLLADYAPGEPAMKPDVLVQIKQIEEERRKMQQQQPQQQQIMINEVGKPPRPLSQQELMQCLNQQLEDIKRLSQRNEYLESLVNKTDAPALPDGLNGLNLSPTISSQATQAPQDNSFATMLLTRISDLEKQLEDSKKPNASFTNMLLSRISDLEKQLSIEKQKNVETKVEEKVEEKVEVKVEEKVETKLKSEPEIMIQL